MAVWVFKGMYGYCVSYVYKGILYRFGRRREIQADYFALASAVSSFFWSSSARFLSLSSCFLRVSMRVEKVYFLSWSSFFISGAFDYMRSVPIAL